MLITGANYANTPKENVRQKDVGQKNVTLDKNWKNTILEYDIDRKPEKSLKMR